MPDYETSSAEVSRAARRREILARALDAVSPTLSAAELEARQAAVGERRRQAGPERVLSATDASGPGLVEDTAGSNVEKTEVIEAVAD